MFTVEGVTPLTGEVIVNYRIQGRPWSSASRSSFDLYDKRAIVWNDDRKVARLITPEDSALKNYGGFIRQACREDVVPAFSETCRSACRSSVPWEKSGACTRPTPPAVHQGAGQSHGRGHGAPGPGDVEVRVWVTART